MNPTCCVRRSFTDQGAAGELRWLWQPTTTTGASSRLHRSEAKAPLFGHIQSPSINCFREVAADIIRAEGAFVSARHLRSGHGGKAHSEITSRVSEAAHCTRDGAAAPSGD